ncbi:MAG: hypothetical protein DRP15_03365, partial [Candidatus Aenigmatarchaeota archaeon]
VGGVYEDERFKTTYSDNWTLTIKSSLRPYIYYPNGQGFIRGNPIPLKGWLEDDCEPVEDAWFQWTIRKIPNQWNRTNTPEYNLSGEWSEDNGWYNYTWLDTNRDTGNYSLDIYVNKQYYDENHTTRENAFFLGLPPTLSDPSIDHDYGGWGELYQFAVKVTDNDLNYNNVTLWKRMWNESENNWTEWKLLNYTYQDELTGKWIYFYHRFTCSDMGLNQFKFRTVDQYGYWDETDPINFTLDVDNVTLTACVSGTCFPESNSTLRRLGNEQAFLNFRIYDSDLGVYPNGTSGKVWITEDYYNYTVELNCTSFNSGYCQVYYDADCDSLVGAQYWKGGTFDNCYYPVNTTPQILYIYGQLYVEGINPIENQTINRNTTIVLNSSVHSDCSNEIVNSTNVTWYNQTWSLMNYTVSNSSEYFNTTWFVPERYELGPEIVHIQANSSYYDAGYNSTLVYVYGWSSVDAIYPENYTEFSAGTDVTITCHVIDINTGESISNYNVSFYKDYILQSVNATDSTGNTSWIWDTSNESAGYYNITCNITDEPVLYYNTSVSEIETIIRIRRQLIITDIIVDNSSIYRNDSYEPYETKITVHINDANIGDAEGADVFFYNETSLIDNCTTNATGWCNITYNPTDDVTPGNYTIYINSTRTGNEDSDTSETYIDVLGVLMVNITSPPNESSWTKLDNITLDANITDERGYVVSGATVEWYNETNKIAEGQHYENFSLIDQSAGNRTIQANATKEFYRYGHDEVIVTISGVADVQWISPNNYSYLPYPEPFDVICRVIDPNSGAPVDDYLVQIYYYYTPPWIFIGNFTTNSTGYVSYNFTPTQKGNVTFLCNISDNTSRLISANIDKVTGLITIWDVTPPVITNVSIIPNESIEANLNYTNITAKVTDDVNVSSVIASILLPNGTIDNRTMLLVENETDLYRVQYIPPIDGVYSVTIYAWDEPPESNENYTFAGNFTVWGKAYGVISQPEEIPVTGITQTQDY